MEMFRGGGVSDDHAGILYRNASTNPKKNFLNLEKNPTLNKMLPTLKQIRPTLKNNVLRIFIWGGGYLLGVDFFSGCRQIFFVLRFQL